MKKKIRICILLHHGVSFIQRISSIGALTTLVVLSVLFPVWLFPAHGIGDLKPLDLNLYNTPTEVYEHLSALGTTGRDAYLEMALTSDLLFPVVYSFALSVALMLALRKLVEPASRLLYLCLLPFLIVLFDWMENLSLAAITRTYPERMETLVYLSSFFTSSKWMLIALSVLILLTALVTKTIGSVSRQRSR